MRYGIKREMSDKKSNAGKDFSKGQEPSRPEELYKSLFYKGDTGFAIYKALDENEIEGNESDYRIVDTNSAYESILGHSREELIGSRLTEITSKMDKQLQAQLALILKKVIHEDGHDAREIVTMSGRWFKVKHYSPQEGYVACVVYEISERKMNEIMAKENHEKLQYVLSNTEAGIFQLNRDGIFTVFQGEILSRVNVSQRSPVGASCYDIDRKKYPYIQKIIDGLEGKRERDEVEIGDHWYEVIFKPYHDSKRKDQGVIGLIIDVTERKLMEKELVAAMERLEKNSIMRNEYIANMSHELRTPINVIYGAIQLFELYMSQEGNTKQEKVKPHIASMKQNCLRLLRLVNNLIDTTKIDSGFYTPALTNQNIVEVIRRIAMSVVDYAYKKGITMTFDSKIQEALVMCDIEMIERIMLNLISNAIKYTENQINIRITHRLGNVYISISDNGIGIAKDKQKIVFERYAQGEDLTTRHSEGSGIGLSLTKSLVEMHNGTICINNKYYGGCEVVIKLPCCKNINRNSVIKNYDYISQDHRLMEKMKVEFADIY